jgi:hypothetical protein
LLSLPELDSADNGWYTEPELSKSLFSSSYSIVR